MLAPLVMHSTIALAVASALLMCIGLGAWLVLGARERAARGG
jgi:hypothetical protein